ncbi:DUF4296 domain-containing protein [Mucilaginibacter sp. dw_454]|uniref:DUF4296 domain-containing protein n=1 Tax=Mucilaginibacter sp. dw_454 TaxID=2720079 RepID=UPI001BD6758E|nr:DUF4296 domain-containing protein [Mucilaginibacter sp. dw_454]
MRKHIILFFSALLFLFSCEGNKDTKGIIDRDEMVKLLVDVHLVDGSLAAQPNGDSLYRQGTGRYVYVFKMHHTDSAQFKKSVAYYVRQPEVVQKMYDDVIKILQAKSDSVNAIIAKDNAATRKHMEKQLQNDTKRAKDSIAAEVKKMKLKMRIDSAKRATLLKSTKTLKKKLKPHYIK